ncbi:MAG: NUDIX domain-containing protein [Bacteroidales bacterium]|nr:NUDIX domain-containing protein [Bacteroidales bacterium]MCF8457275.1 NUDIX domain-containing protein [Bacteroidales bacterium]
MIHIYFFDRVLRIAKPGEFPELTSKTIVFDGRSGLKDFVLGFEASSEFETALIENPDPEKILDDIKESFRSVEAAGGLVKKPDGTFLVIERLGVWDLPKGKIDKPENPLEAAIREIEEECGVSDIRMRRGLQPMYHTYWLKEKFILKKTYWFEFEYEGDETPKPQQEENITQAGFVDKSRIPEILGRTYPSIRDVLVEVFPEYKMG